MDGLIAHSGAQLLGRQDLPALATPPATETHHPVPHAMVVEALIESLGYRHIEVAAEQYAATTDGSRLFGVLEMSMESSDVRFALGLRNSHDKSFSLAFTVGYRVFVCDNLAFYGDFTPVTRKHSKRLDTIEVVDMAVSKMQRHFEPMLRQIDAWKEHTLPDSEAKLLIYDAFVAGKLKAPRYLARVIHDAYFVPRHPEFEPRTLWSLSNAFTAALKALDPIPRIRATARLGEYLRGLE